MVSIWTCEWRKQYIGEITLFETAYKYNLMLQDSL